MATYFQATVMMLSESASTSELSSSTGYECNFVSEPDDSLKCLICVAIARDPWQHGKCGRLFCESCLNSYGKHNPCPNCRMKRPQYMEDTRSKREIAALRVKCDNIGRSCKWKGSVSTLDEHVATCKFTPVPCPKECKKYGELHMIMRKDLEKHLNEQCVNRDYECKYCGKKDTYINITDLHEEVCEKKIVPCTNSECIETMEQASLKKHLEKCKYTSISCRYKRLGCHTKMKRKYMGAHEQDDKAHLHQALDTVVKLQESLESAIRTIALKTYQGVSFTFKVQNYSKKKEKKEIVYSQPFYTDNDGYYMRIVVYPNGCGGGKDTHISVYVEVLKGNYDDNLNWPFVGSVKLELLNQLQDNNHHHMTASFNKETVLQVGGCRGYSKYIAHSQLSKGPACESDHFSSLYGTQYLKDDTLYFRITVKTSNYKPWLKCTATNYSQQV